MGFDTTYSMKDRVLQLTTSCCIAYEKQCCTYQLLQTLTSQVWTPSFLYFKNCRPM